MSALQSATVVLPNLVRPLAASCGIPIHRHVKKCVSAETPSSFIAGDKLLCINSNGLRRPYSPAAPVEGLLYCCRETYTDNGQPGVLLVGVFCPITAGGLECGLLASRFRLVHRCGGGQ